jgi:hypothetical protein
LPDTAETSSEWLFVPADPCLPRLKFSMTGRFGYHSQLFRRLLSKELKREVTIVFATHSKRTDLFEFSLAPSINRANDLLIFEIPDTKRCYTVASLILRKKGQLVGWDDKIDDFFLVELPTRTLRLDEIQRVCEEKFAFMWDSSPGDENAQKILHKSTPRIIELVEQSQPVGGQQKLTVEFRQEISRRVPFIANRAIQIRFNPGFMKAVFGFQWSRFFRPTVETVLECRTLEPTLENCLKQFCCGAVLDESNTWQCTECNRDVAAEKAIEIWSVPKILIIHLRRFGQFSGVIRKIQGEIAYPDVLDISEFVVGQKPEKYQLFAVCQHHGTSYGGHYVAHVKGEAGWIFCNDAMCRPADQAAAHNESAYILFYRQAARK